MTPIRTSLMLALLCACLASNWDLALADPNDELIMSKLKMVTDAWGQKCATKKEYMAKDAMALFNGCVEPMIQSAKFIPAKIYPEKYKELVAECVSKVPENTNLCDAKQGETLTKCMLRYGMSTFAQAKKLMDEKKAELAKLVDEAVTKCLPVLNA